MIYEKEKRLAVYRPGMNQEGCEVKEDRNIPLNQLINNLPQRDDLYRFADDIASAHHVLLDQSKIVSQKETELRKWLSRYQPCIFGRAGSMGKANLNIDICWITEEEIAFGEDYLKQKIQRARKCWKDRAEFGFSSGFLILFNVERMARAIPGQALVHLSLSLSRLYLVEQDTIEPDTIYTEAVPLRMPDGQLTLFKAGCNIFYTGADRTRNHDRRIPGGLLFSINSPGHFANSLFIRGKCKTLEDAIQRIRDLALRSIGNGGIGYENIPSTSWHNRTGKIPEGGCPIRHNPPYIPDDVDMRRYSAFYHTDVLVPTDVTSDATDYVEVSSAEVWPHLVIDYITSQQFPPDHPNYGLFQGHPIKDTEKYANPWQPRRAQNKELFGEQ
jgi:hypothetical protein